MPVAIIKHTAQILHIFNYTADDDTIHAKLLNVVYRHVNTNKPVG